MRKLLLYICALLFFQLGFSQGFVVENAEVEVFINKNGYFDVVEKYDIFFESEKHGIIRDIQTRYKLANADGEVENRHIEISKIKVPGDKFTKTPKYKEDLNGRIEIKIGRANKLIKGPKRYEIRYRVRNAFIHEKTETHFYWNIKPKDWSTRFHGLEFKIHPPKGVHVGLDNFFVYSGKYGNDQESTEFDIRQEGDVFVVKSHPDFISDYSHSVTALLKLPADSIKESSSIWSIFDYIWVLILGGGAFGYYSIWEKYGKDDKVITTTSYFAPEGIDPPMAGYLIDDKADSNDLMSLLPFWGAQGIIRMEQIPKKGLFKAEDTRLIKLRALPVDRPNYEKEIFSGLFINSLSDEEESVLVSSLKNKFYSTMGSAKSSLKKEAQIYYDQQSERIKMITIGFTVAGGIGFSILFLHTWGLVAGASVIVVSLILLLLSRHLTKRNAKGNEILTELKGLQQFIKISEENQLKMLVQEDPNYFEKTMAYALALGLFKQWAKKFEGLDVPPPKWYSSPVGVASMNSFSNSFTSSIGAAHSNMVSTPSRSSGGGGSSGGGSSGGGFGGGGGRSW